MASSEPKQDGVSKRSMILGGLALAGIAGAIVYMSFAGSKKALPAPAPAPDKKAKKTKKKAKKNKSKSKSKASSPAPAAAVQAPAPAAPAPAAAEPATAPEPAAAATVEDVEDESGLQTSGPIDNEMFLKFFEQSNNMLKEQDIKDQSAAVYQAGKSVGDFLKQKQATLWKTLGIDPKYGIKQISEALRSGSMTFQESLRASVQIENDLFTYAYYGNQEAVDEQNNRIKRLMEEGSKELQEEAKAIAHDRAAMQKMMEKLMGRYKEISQRLSAGPVQDPMDLVKIKAELTDADMKIMLQGQQIMQQMAMEQQRMQMMQQMQRQQ